MRKIKIITWVVAMFCFSGFATSALASDVNINIPDLTQTRFDGLGGVSGVTLMYLGLAMCVMGAVFGLVQYRLTKALPVHASMGRCRT